MSVEDQCSWPTRTDSAFSRVVDYYHSIRYSSSTEGKQVYVQNRTGNSINKL